MKSFVSYRGIIGSLFLMWQLLENFLEKSILLYIIFADVKKAFDSVYSMFRHLLRKPGNDK